MKKRHSEDRSTQGFLEPVKSYTPKRHFVYPFKTSDSWYIREVDGRFFIVEPKLNLSRPLHEIDFRTIFTKDTLVNARPKYEIADYLKIQREHVNEIMPAGSLTVPIIEPLGFEVYGFKGVPPMPTCPVEGYQIGRLYGRLIYLAEVSPIKNIRMR